MEEVRKKQTALEQLIENKNKFHCFDGMSDADILSIIIKVEFNTFEQGEIIIKEGDKSEMVYFILSGNCNVIANRSIVGNLPAHSLFGEIAGIEKRPRQATVRATKDTLALSFLINYANFERSMAPFAYFFRNIAKNLVHKLTLLNARKKSSSN